MKNDPLVFSLVDGSGIVHRSQIAKLKARQKRRDAKARKRNPKMVMDGAGLKRWA